MYRCAGVMWVTVCSGSLDLRRKVLLAMGPELPFLGGRVVGVWPPAQIRHVGFRWQSGNQRTGGTLLSR